jgi:hypothetical protein
MCSNTDKSIIPIDETGWVAKECNNFGIQGSWYCYSDGINMSSCMKDTVPYTAGMGMCLSGVLSADSTAWGAGVGLGLNDSGTNGGTTTSVKSPYNATMNGVLGFHVEISGDTGMQPVRIGFTGSEAPTDPSPFWEVPGPGKYDVKLADTLVPKAWDTPSAGTTADPTKLYDMQIQIAGGTIAANYNFCVTNVTPITDPNAMMMGGTVANYGSSQCGTNAEINLGNKYTIRNNVYNASGGNECIQALWDNGDKAGFIINPVSLNVQSGGAPGSYPSIVTGWHYGTWHGGYTAAKAVSAVTAVPTTWAFTVPSAGSYDVSYDVWMNNTNANPSTPSGGLELMVWLNQRDTTPIGTKGPTVMIGGQSWTVWYGPNSGGWNTVSYVATSNLTSYTGDLKPFFADSVTRGYINNSGYLLGVQAGFEVWNQTMSMTTNSYTVSIN